MNIAQVMDMSVDEAREFFDGEKFTKQLDSLHRTGLGYLHLNQSLTTLSGGELQRLKLASQLYRRGSVFIIDEPTDGLHIGDIRTLMKLFNEMTDDGNSLFLVEHSLEVMKEADWLIELGPGGGEFGGELLFCGRPQEILASNSSVTAPYLSASLPDGEKNLGGIKNA